MNGSKFYTEAVDSSDLRVYSNGRRALDVRYKSYRKERWWGVQVIMPE